MFATATIILGKIWAAIWSRIKLVFRLLLDNWTVSLPVILALFLVFFMYRSCGKKAPSIDIKSVETIEKINSGNEAERKKQLQDLVEDNAEVVKTVDETKTIAETNVIERNRLIDEKVKEADRKVQEAKKNLGRDVTATELECLLTGKQCQ